LSYGNSLETGDRVVNRNPLILITLALCLVLILGLRLFSIQVLKYSHFLTRSDEIRIKRKVIEAPRGFIFDRNGSVLAENLMTYSITVDPTEWDSLDVSIPRLASLVPELPKMLNVSGENMVQKIKEQIRGSFNPEKIIRDVNFRLLSIVEEHNHELPGVGGVFDQGRRYPYGPLAAHVIGYMGEVTRKELGTLKDKGYKSGYSIGRHGIEKYYEDALKGENGAKFVEMNYQSRILGITNYGNPIRPEPGENITLTLDVRMQMTAREAFGDTVRGALVALDPRNGEVLVMASLPSFDPNEFAHTMSSERYASLVNDLDSPLFNRAIQATYPPGSPIKTLTALAGLENGFNEDTRFQPCMGSYYYGRTYNCWKEGGHGSLDMVQAITQSCNVYFYQLGRKLSIERWHKYGAIVGLGQKTGIDLLDEKPGIFPTPEYYKNINVAYSPGMMLNLVMGQGENLTTILQLAHYTGIIATEGLDATPHLVKTEYTLPRRITEISRESFMVVKKGMLGVVHDPAGTAKSARITGHRIAGKTGTAQNPHGADHKLFIAFAPYDNPTIAIACVAENAGDYPFSLAVRIVKKVLTEYFLYYPDNMAAVNE
jgi:penicillin-binding protein 2